MHKYIPATPSGKQEMLNAIGVSNVEELFKTIPDDVKCHGQLNLPDGMAEIEAGSILRRMSKKNANVNDYVCFLGAGAYDHYIPSAIDQLLLRQEFFTAYTPYQAEVSQGTLQAAFEYQSYICMLTGMDVTNASMYDGATALAEAAIMACGITKRNEVLVSKSVSPMSRQVFDTYACFRGMKVIEFGISGGKSDIEDARSKLNQNTAAVIVQSPNFFGVIEDVKKFSELAHCNGSLLVESSSPLFLALFETPGALGADIAVGDGQLLGLPLSFGGPYLGFLAVKQQHLRRMPGRIIGQTLDKDGKTGYVMTLTAREQHIRREKATSNICSNHALCALAATMYLTLMGKEGFIETAKQCLNKAHYAYSELVKTSKFKPLFNAPFFMEFALEYSGDADELNSKLLKDGIIGGYALSNDYPELKNSWLIAVTEKRTKEEIDEFVRKAAQL